MKYYAFLLLYVSSLIRDSTISAQKTVVPRCLYGLCETHTDEPTKKLSSYKDKIPQPTEQQQKSYPKDATDFINLKAKKASKRSDNHFNGHYAVTDKYTPNTTPPPKKKKW